MKKTSSDKVNAETRKVDADSNSEELSAEDQMAKSGFFLSEDIAGTPEADQVATAMAAILRTMKESQKNDK
jgi:hypothetical protein